MVTGLKPFTLSCIESLWAKVVFPDEDGPAIKTTFFLCSLKAIISAICAIFFSCKASATLISSFILPSFTMSFSALTSSTPSIFPHFLYSANMLKSFFCSLNCGIASGLVFPDSSISGRADNILNQIYPDTPYEAPYIHKIVLEPIAFV